MSDMDHVSPNHANALLVRNHPPAARQGNSGGRARGIAGALAKHRDSQLRQDLLSLRRVTVGEFGSEILTQVGLCDAGTAGRSALQRAGLPKHSMTLALCHLGGAGWQPGRLQRPSHERQGLEI